MAEPFVGEIRLFAFGLIPSGWAPCNGQLLQISSNQALYSILGTRYGGNGTTTFALPNLQGRTPINTTQGFPLGVSAGSTEHTLTIAEMPQHTHQAQANSTQATLPSPAGNVWGATPASRPIYASTVNTTMNHTAIGVAGSTQAHNNLQPYTTVTFCIALIGYYPTRP